LEYLFIVPSITNRPQIAILIVSLHSSIMNILNSIQDIARASHNLIHTGIVVITHPDDQRSFRYLA